MSTEPVIGTNAQPIQPNDLAARLKKHERFVSRLVEPHHDLLVYVPPSYEVEPARRFPVLYMQDGQNLFDPATAYIEGNYWRMGETADLLIGSGAIASLIIVGIYNSGVRRIDEYTPAADKRLGGGHADVYGRMLVEELKPFIDETYRTLPGAAHCGLGGSSLGGLVSLYLGLQYPAVFSRVAVMSPSVWWRRRAILKTIAQLARKPDLRIWLDIGMNEGSRAVPDTRLLRKALVDKGWEPGQDLAYTEAEGGEHTEASWAERTGPMLKYLFAGPDDAASAPR